MTSSMNKILAIKAKTVGEKVKYLHTCKNEIDLQFMWLKSENIFFNVTRKYVLIQKKKTTLTVLALMAKILFSY